MKQILFAICLLLCAHGLCQTTDNHKLIDALVTMPDPGGVYYDDGAGDGSILRSGEHKEYVLTKPLREVQDIVALKHDSIPLLIDCLTDTRPTRITFTPSRWAAPNLSNPIRVPVAFVCLDILSEIVDQHPKIFDVDCSCDGMGAEYKPGYYFKPEIAEVNGQQRGLAMMR